MKILYLHQYFNTPAMAGGTRSYEMAKRLVASGHEVHMITSFRDQCDTKTWFHTVEEGIHVHWYPILYNNALSYNERIKAFIKFVYVSAKKAASISADIIFATSTPLTIALPAVYAARRQKIPMVFEVRDLWPELPIAIGALKNPFIKYAARRLERFAYKNAKRIVALSPGMATGVEKSRYPAHHISIIPNSCDLDLFQPDSKKADRFRQEHIELENRPIILYPGTLGKINGVGWLVHLAARLQALGSDCCFVVIGAGMEWDEVKELASEQGVLNKNFFMYQQMPKQKLVEAFCAVSMIVSLFIDLPEMEANSANKFFDALASGTAIAVNYGGWQADLIRKYEVGLTLSRDIHNAADSLLEFLADKEKVVKCGDNGRNLATSHYSRDDLAQNLEKVLSDAIQ
ncbi:MAG: glycosyltransferase WbuB [Candidatus Electrothrix sp. AW3_4]|nr:glycosyltransferase WbuB [Candidatus Electrothrix gigas]